MANEVCVITSVPAVPIVVSFFSVDSTGDLWTYCYDHIEVNGQRYCGSAGPDGVISTSGTIYWESDDEYQNDGWELCWPFGSPSTPPSVPPPSAPPSPPGLCNNECPTARDGKCDDAGLQPTCAWGTDWCVLHIQVRTSELI